MSATEELKHRGLIFRVAVPSPLRRLFDYLPPSGITAALPAGIRVLIPFGNREIVGILIECVDGSPLTPGRLKKVKRILDQNPIFTPALFKTLYWAASYYQHPIGDVFSSALPARVRSSRPIKSETTVWKVAGRLTAGDKNSLLRAKKQKALLELIAGRGAISNAEITALGFSQRLLNQLEQKQFIARHLVAAPEQAPFQPISATGAESLQLNADQQAAVKAISNNLQAFSCFLLDGVTGSGKTEIYMQLMQRQLSKGKQCLVLVPEIGLTPQTLARFEERFSCPIVALHSGLSDSERLEAWNQAREGSAAIVIGTRSAVFTPLANPGLIVVDEEHDASYKQQDGFRYSARDLAVMRASEEQVPIILGSATPSLESLHNARSKKFGYLQLAERAGAAEPAAMKVIDISEKTLDTGFSEQLLFKMQQHLSDHNQVLVFINRRGFAPLLNCQHCGWVAECDNCIAQLTVHVKPPGLRCHHCGTSRQLPDYCPSCKSSELTTLGLGTQRIEQFLLTRFAGIPVLRIDRDSTRSKSRFEEMLQQIHQGDPCILIGTQMLAKGHHFPSITLVAILDADAGLFSADFRGQEHMAQTITQVAGRAGRAQRPGEVLIQSRHASHVALQSLTRESYAAFAELLLSERQDSAMPPYSHLALIHAEATQLKSAISFLTEVSSLATEICAKLKLNIERIGPVPAPMEKRAGRFRVQLLLKSQSRGSMAAFLSRLCEQIDLLKQPAKLRWGIDVDPQDLI